MKHLYLIMLLYICLPLVALAGPPTCYPGDPTAAETVPSVVIQSGGACIQWHCDIGHKWAKQYICGTWSEATTVAIDSLRTAMASDKATKDALWTSTFTQPVPASDQPMMTAMQSAPMPAAIPPSGLVTTAVFAYKLTSPINSTPTFALGGTVALGIPCDTSQRFGPYFRIDRTAVKVPTGALLATNYYAKCD